jgi:MFS transporter, ACS family, glucarate transporter
VLIRIVLWWSAFTALTGAVWVFSFELLPGVVLNSFLLLLAVRFLFGAGEAGALPNAARVISVWFPPGKRGPSQALISTCAQIGGAAAPALAAYFIQSPYIGWRWAFVIFGSLGVVWAWFFARWFRDDPATHPDVNAAERRYILGDRAPAVAAAPSSHQHRIPWRLVLTNRNIWLLGIINSCTSFFSYMLFLWFPTYLKEGRGLDELTSGRLGSLPYLFGASGVLLGGFVGDWLTRRTGSRRLALGGMGTVGLLLAGTLVGSSVLADWAVVAVLLCSVGYFFSYIQLAAWWAAMGDIGGRHLGALFGLCNMIGLAGGAISQVFLGSFADHMKALGFEGRAQWDPAFYLYGGVLMFGGLLWLFINPRRTVVPDDSDHV